MTNGCRKWRNRLQREKFVVLAENLWQQTNCRRYKRKIGKPRRGLSWRNQPNLFIFPDQTNGNHATELSAVGHVISDWHWNSTFDFTEAVNNYRLKRGAVCQIISFISHYSLKLHMQYWNFFHSMVLGRVGGDYSKKNRVLKCLAKMFGQFGSAPLSELQQ